MRFYNKTDRVYIPDKNSRFFNHSQVLNGCRWNSDVQDWMRKAEGLVRNIHSSSRAIRTSKVLTLTIAIKLKWIRF